MKKAKNKKYLENCLAIGFHNAMILLAQNKEKRK